MKSEIYIYLYLKNKGFRKKKIVKLKSAQNKLSDL